MMVKNVAGLVSAAKFKKNTISLHKILPTHVYAKFKTDETDVFGFFMNTSKWRGING